MRPLPLALSSQRRQSIGHGRDCLAGIRQASPFGPAEVKALVTCPGRTSTRKVSVSSSLVDQGYSPSPCPCDPSSLSSSPICPATTLILFAAPRLDPILL